MVQIVCGLIDQFFRFVFFILFYFFRIIICEKMSTPLAFIDLFISVLFIYFKCWRIDTQT